MRDMLMSQLSELRGRIGEKCNERNCQWKTVGFIQSAHIVWEDFVLNP